MAEKSSGTALRDHAALSAEPAKSARKRPTGGAMMPPTKTSLICAEMAAENWRRAIALAARLPRLGKHRDAILDAHNAFVRPEWARQLKQDPERHKAAGIAALKEKFG